MLKVLIALLLSCTIALAEPINYNQLYNKVLDNQGRKVYVSLSEVREGFVHVSSIPGETKGLFVCWSENGTAKIAPYVSTPVVTSKYTDPTTGCTYETLSDGTTRQFCPLRK